MPLEARPTHLFWFSKTISPTRQASPRRSATRTKPNAVTREFCAQCGTQVSTVRPDMAGKRVVKIGTFDAPQEWPGPGFAIFTAQKAPWHVIPPDLPAFPELPPR